MAEKTIGIRIQLNGLNTIIKDIGTLEDEIRKAKEDLKQVEIGGPIFNQLQKEISAAEGQLRKLNQQTEGLTNEKKAEGIGKLGAGISSSFAAATAAVSLFGNKSESVTKAAAQAQNLLTLALSTRGIMEIRTGAQITARVIAEKAATLAVETENVALKSLYTTLAANPYGAILAAVGLLVAAFVTLGSEEEQVAEKTKTLNELRTESEKSIIGEVNKLQILQKILNDGNASLDAKKGAYMELQKLVPTLTNLTYEQAQAQGVLNTSIEDEIKLIQLRAKQKAYEDYFVQQESKNIEKRTKQREDYLKSLNVEISQLKQRMFMDGYTYKEVEQAVEQLKRRKLAQKGYTSELDDYQDVVEQVLEIEQKQTTIVKGQKTATEDVTKSEEKRKKQIEALITALGEQAKIEAQLLLTAIKLEERNVDVVKTLEENVSAADSYTKSLNQLKSVEELIVELNKQLSPSNDKVGKAFDELRKQSESYFDSIKDGLLSQEEVIKQGQLLKESARSIGEGLGLSENDIKLLEKYVLNYTQFTDAVNKFQTKDIKPPFKAADFEKDLIDVALLTNKIKVDPYSLLDPSNPNYRDPKKLQSDLLNAQERLQKDQEGFIKSYVELRKQEVDLTKFSVEEQQKLTKTYEEAGKIAFENLVNVGNEVIVFEDGVVSVGNKVTELNNKLKELAPTARRGFIVSNAEEIAKQYGTTIPLVLRNEQALNDLRDKLRKKNYEEDVKYQQALINLEADLAAQGIDIAKLTYAERLALLEKFLDKEVAATKTAEDKKKEARDKTIEGIQKGLQEFNSLVGKAASLTAQYFEFQQKKLDKFYKDQLETVVGDTEEANQKRAELDKQYQAQKAELEKRALIKSLQFQLAQAIADGAQAVLSVIEIPPLAVIVGALAAAQVALIAQQLNYAQSLASGGKVKMGAGGMLMGPSHEYGGISYAGGVNLEGGESVINKNSSLAYGSLISSINQMGGGQPIVNNPTGSLQEERLLQILAKDRQTPLRAYVLSSEITNSQAVNRRLDELATL